VRHDEARRAHAQRQAVEFAVEARELELAAFVAARGREFEALVAAAEQVDLGLYPIAPYYADPPPRAGLLLGYAGLSPRDLAEAARRLARLLPAARPSPPRRAALRHNVRSERTGR